MLDSLRNCFRDNAARSEKTDPPEACIFCNITAERGFKVVYEDQHFVWFQDRSPGARMHVLCVPRQHIDNVKTLTASDVPMLKCMKTIGTRLLDEAGFADVQHRLGFHIPPFFSVNHLHLHILGLPCQTFWDRLKYRPAYSDRAHKGLSHFVQIDQAIAIIESGKRVSVQPC